MLGRWFVWMARLPRMVLPGVPHHVTQRGNRRERTFFEDGDYALYLDLLAQAADRHGVEVWSYCLMPNHVHIIAVPRDEDALGRTFRDVHHRYTGKVNTRLRRAVHRPVHSSRDHPAIDHQFAPGGEGGAV